ncbi:hypothetical protein V2J09_022445 [Rumex salicifolius]
MGKATRWLKGLLQGLKGYNSTSATRPEDSRTRPPPKEKRRWSFVKSYRDKSSSFSNPKPRRPDDSDQFPSATRLQASSDGPDDANKHAIVVAAASAAAAEAAVAAAQAAAAVVRLTTSGRRVTPPSAHVSAGADRKSWAALVIQSQFRGYLARRALKALKGLVKLQALVRGHIMRKKTAETMRCIQAMLRAQARARSVLSYDSPTSSGKSSQINHPEPPTPEKSELTSHFRNTKTNQSGMQKGNCSRTAHRVPVLPVKGYVSTAWSGPQLGESMWDATRGRHTQYHREGYYIRPDKILEIDTGRPPPQFGRFGSNRGLEFYSGQLTQSFTPTTSKEETTAPSPGSYEIQSSGHAFTQEDDDDGAFCTAENSPRFYLGRRRKQGGGGGLHTPTKSDASATSCFSGYSDCPSYMAYTESSKAKMRSMSAPRQRPQQLQQQQCYERGSSMKRWSVHHQRAVGPGSAAAMHASFASKAYPGSGHLDRLGMPIRSQNSVVYYSGYLN